jgi:hypothetical protein
VPQDRLDWRILSAAHNGRGQHGNGGFTFWCLGRGEEQLIQDGAFVTAKAAKRRVDDHRITGIPFQECCRGRVARALRSVPSRPQLLPDRPSVSVNRARTAFCTAMSPLASRRSANRIPTRARRAGVASARITVAGSSVEPSSVHNAWSFVRGSVAVSAIRRSVGDGCPLLDQHPLGGATSRSDESNA